MKKENQCLFCRSLKCYSRIVSTRDNGKTYDEVACRKHASDLDKHSDEITPKVNKLFITSTGELSRGKSIEKEMQEIQEMESKNH